MSEMIERCAKAAVSCYDMQKLAKNNPEAYTAALGIVKIVFAAAHEPTREMLSAGGFYHISGAGCISESDMEIAKREWQAMIDVIIRDQ